MARGSTIDRTTASLTVGGAAIGLGLTLDRVAAADLSVAAGLAYTIGLGLVGLGVGLGFGRLGASIAEEARSERTAAPSSSAAVAVRAAIGAGDWIGAADRLAAIDREFPDAPEAAGLRAAIDAGRAAAAADLRDRIEAARAANDPAAILELRGAITPLLDEGPRRDLDRQAAGWMLALISRRLRAGTTGPDVAELAGRAAEAFGALPEGASLRASLPTLRRSAGLCARCAKPYRGVADACPDCQNGAAPNPRATP